MRDFLNARMRPAVDAFVEDLCQLLEEREFARVGETMHTALSAIASTLDQPDIVVLAADATEPGTLKVDEWKPVPGRRGRGIRKNPPASIVRRDTKPAKAPTARRVPANKGGKMVCKACGFVGGNARGCGRSHPTQDKSEPTAARPARTEPPSAPPAFASKPDRFAQIEASARARQGTNGV